MLDAFWGDKQVMFDLCPVFIVNLLWTYFMSYFSKSLNMCYQQFSWLQTVRGIPQLPAELYNGFIGREQVKITGLCFPKMEAIYCLSVRLKQWDNEG